MHAASGRVLAVAGLVSALVMCGCSTVSSGFSSVSSGIADLPAPIGLPAGTPERAAGETPYPAVHDMPPPRETKLLSEEERKAVEADLARARDRQSGSPAAKSPAAKKRSTD